MNSVMGPSFKVRFVFFRTCGSHKQCTGPSKKKTQTHGLLLSKPSQSTTCATFDLVLKLDLHFFIFVGHVNSA